MKKFLRPVAALCVAAMLSSCTSPYQAEMGELNRQYANGQISQREYNNEMNRLQRQDAGWQQQNANNATAAAIGVAAVAGTAAIINNNDHHHHYHGGYYYRHGHRYWY
jgi:uncharacterized membrane protein